MIERLREATQTYLSVIYNAFILNLKRIIVRKNELSYSVPISGSARLGLGLGLS
jgi:hypothetical protein